MNVRKIAFIAIGINRQVKRILIIIHLSKAVRPHLLSQQNLLLMAVQEITAVHIASHIPEKEKTVLIPICMTMIIRTITQKIMLKIMLKMNLEMIKVNLLMIMDMMKPMTTGKMKWMISLTK